MRGIVTLVACVSVACAPRAHFDGDHATSGDPQRVFVTARGIVVIAGSEPRTALLLMPAGDAQPFALTGEATPLLRSVAGVEVEVEGERVGGAVLPDVAPDTPQLDVRHFTVIAVNGVAAQDGTLEHDGAGFHLRLHGGERIAVRELPPSLRQHVGARIFLAGPLDRAPSSYGIIAPGPQRD
jgi:hypothetical protein